MGTKRPHTDTADALSGRPSSKKRKPSSASHPPSTGGPSKSIKGRHKPAPAPNPLNPLKSRIRSLRRLLAHDDDADARAGAMHPERSAALLLLHSAEELEVASKHARRDEGRARRLPAGVRVERERELAGLEERVRELERKRARNDVVGRWHKIRFFERRRAERRLKKVRKEGGDEHAAEVDLNYALCWPLERDYVALWPRQREGEREGEERKGDKEMWKLVEKCMAEGTLEELREGRVEGCGVERVEEEERKQKKSAREEKKSKKKVVAKEEDSDDGGFFEE